MIGRCLRSHLLSTEATCVMLVQVPSIWWADPVGAILISMYIIYSWAIISKSQVRPCSTPPESVDCLTVVLC